jgi:hypothetical protein
MDNEFYKSLEKFPSDKSLLQWIDSFDDTKLDSIEPLPWKTDLSNNICYPTDSTPTSSDCSEAIVETIDSATPSDYWRRHQEANSHPIYAPDRFDVVVGRGQAIQRLSGNETYRELVSVNKVR